MLQESRLPRWTFYRYSRSISQRSSLSWITTRNRMVRTEVQRVGWTCERGPYILITPEEKRRYKGHWYLTLNKTRKNGPMKLRSDYRAAVIMKNRLHHETGEPTEEPIHPGQQRRIRRGHKEHCLSNARIDQHTGWQKWLSISSSSWWHESQWSWKWAHIFLCSNLFF